MTSNRTVCLLHNLWSPPARASPSGQQTRFLAQAQTQEKRRDHAMKRGSVDLRKTHLQPAADAVMSSYANKESESKQAVVLLDLLIDNWDVVNKGLKFVCLLPTLSARTI